MARYQAKGIIFLFGCLGLATIIGCKSASKAAPLPTSTTTPIESPSPTDITPPQPTFDAAVQPYLVNVEEILRHSAVVIKERAVGIPDACPDMYIMAFPYSEPDQRGGMTIAVTDLKRKADGTIIPGEHEYLWNLKGEGADPERCKDIFIQNRSEPGLIRISFQVQDPDDRSWRIGVASGPCPGIDLWLAGYFYLRNPDDFDLLITQYDPRSPTDYWLRDGKQLHYYQWEPWQESLLWTLEEIPGDLHSVTWSQDTEDFTGDGKPDLLITWEVDSGLISQIYRREGSGFTFVRELVPE